MAKYHVSDIITVTILNWKKFNPRDDLKYPTWFRCEKSLFDNHELCEFSNEELLAWLYLKCLATDKKSDTITIGWAHIKRVNRFRAQEMLSALEKLESFKIVQVSVQMPYGICTESVRDPNSTVRYGTDGTDDTIRDGKQNPIGLLPLTALDLLNLWNENCKTLPKVIKLTDARKAHAKAQLAKYPDLEHWTQVLLKFTSSEFCLNTWKPNFDDFLNENKRIAALEGRYETKSGGRGKKDMTIMELEALRASNQ